MHARRARVVNCNGVTGSFQGDFTLGYPANQAPIDVTVAVSAAGVDETAPADNTRTVRLREVPPTVLDPRAGCASTSASIFDAGQFQAIVSWPVAAADPARIRFHDIAPLGDGLPPRSARRVRRPKEPTSSAPSTTPTATTPGRRPVDLDMTAIVLLQPVNVAMKVSVEPSNGTAAGADTERLAWPLSLC